MIGGKVNTRRTRGHERDEDEVANGTMGHSGRGGDGVGCGILAPTDDRPPRDTGYGDHLRRHGAGYGDDLPTAVQLADEGQACTQGRAALQPVAPQGRRGSLDRTGRRWADAYDVARICDWARMTRGSAARAATVKPDEASRALSAHGGGSRDAARAARRQDETLGELEIAR